MKPPDSGTPSPSDSDDSGRVTFEGRARRAARLALMASLPLMAAVLVFMLVRGEEIPAEMWFVAVVWAGWVVYTLRGLGRARVP